jgi:large subunit ribosomal protein L21
MCHITFREHIMRKAIIQTGSKQYLVSEGDIIDVELLNTEDNSVNFKEVLFLKDGDNVQLGSPHLPIQVKGEVVSEIKGTKLIVFKYKKRKNYKIKKGHRSRYARVKITAIGGN